MQIDFAFTSKKERRLVRVCVSFCFMHFFLDLTPTTARGRLNEKEMRKRGEGIGNEEGG